MHANIQYCGLKIHRQQLQESVWTVFTLSVMVTETGPTHCQSVAQNKRFAQPQLQHERTKPIQTRDRTGGTRSELLGEIGIQFNINTIHASMQCGRSNLHGPLYSTPRNKAFL